MATFLTYRGIRVLQNIRAPLTLTSIHLSRHGVVPRYPTRGISSANTNTDGNDTKGHGDTRGKDGETGGRRSTNRRLVHIEAFFAQYAPRFQHNPNEHPSFEFRRLVEESGWVINGDKKGRLSEEEERVKAEMKAAYDLAKAGYNEALVKQFGAIYGTDDESLDSWMLLCEVLGVEPIPETLGGCKKQVRQKHANLVDLVHAGFTGETVKTFRRHEMLRWYTIRENKFFPKDEAKESRLLKALMRGILVGRFNKPRLTRTVE